MDEIPLSLRALEKRPIPLLKFGFIELLPVELTSTIFTLSCQADSFEFLSADLKVKKEWTTPLRLGSVCTAWRNLVWTIPEIWSHIFILVTSTRYDSQVSLLRDWLARSNPYPLTIVVSFEDHYHWLKHPPRDLILALASASNRWFSINGVLPQNCHSIVEEYAEFPLLTTITLKPLEREDASDDESDSGDTTSSTKTPPLVERSPRLSRLLLHGYSRTKLNIQWANLTWLNYQYPSVTIAKSILLQSPNLISCSFNGWAVEDESDEGDSGPDISLPRLQELVIQSPWTQVSKLLSSMKAPMLHTLETSTSYSEVNLEDLASHIDDIGGRVRKLTLHQILPQTRNVKFWAFFKQHPEFEDVEISLSSSVDRSYYFARDLFMVPDCDECPSAVLPNLKRFVLKGPCKPAIRSYDTELIAGLERRWLHGKINDTDMDTEYTMPFTRISEFTLIDTTSLSDSVGARFDPPALQMLHNLQARGMHLHIGGWDERLENYMRSSRLRRLERRF